MRMQAIQSVHLYRWPRLVDLSIENGNLLFQIASDGCKLSHQKNKVTKKQNSNFYRGILVWSAGMI